MKRIIFFALVAIAIGAVCWFVNFRNSKYLDGEIAEHKLWDEILQGTWEYDFQSQGGEHYIVGKGEMTFNADKSYTFYKTHNYYYDKRHKKNALVVVGGSVSGAWKTEDERISFEVDQCNLKVTKDDYGELDNPCETALLNIGNFSSENGVGKLHTLNAETIIFSFNNYTDNSIDQITFKKKGRN